MRIRILSMSMLVALSAAWVLGAPNPSAGAGTVAEFRIAEEESLQDFTLELGRRKVQQAEGETLTREYVRDMIRRREAFRDGQRPGTATLELNKDIVRLALDLLDDEEKVKQVIASAGDPEQAAQLKIHAARIYASAGQSKQASKLAREVTGSSASNLWRWQAEMVLFHIDPRGRPFPEFPKDLKDLEGRPLRLSEYKGKVVLVDFWASWWDPCMMQEPEFVALHNQYRAKGFEIVGLSLDDSKDEMRDAMKKHGMAWRQNFLGGGIETNPVAQYYGVWSIPSVYLVGRDGKVVRKIIGGRQQLAPLLKKLLD